MSRRHPKNPIEDEDDLEPGTFTYPPGDIFVERKPVQVDGDMRWFQRVTYVDDLIVDFNVGLQIDAGHRGLCLVTRLCTSHSNYHVHRHTLLPTRGKRECYGLLHSQKDVQNAFFHAQWLYEDAEKEVARWRRGR